MASRRSARIIAQAEARPAEKTSTMPPPSAPAAKSRKRKASLAAPTAENVGQLSAISSRKRKPSSSAPAADDEEVSSTAAPSTPRRRTTKTKAPPPATPTPSAVGLIAEPAVTNGLSTPATPKSLSSTVTTPNPKPRALARLADPNSTNAPLLSPETSRVVSSKPIDQTRPPSTSSSQPPTTANILNAALAHLIATEPRLKPIVEAHHCRIFSPEGLAEKIDPFESLTSGIISQQVSGAAAKAIKTRFIALFDPASAADATTTTTTKKFPTPSQVSASSIEKLRSAGLSQRKAEYVQGLAEKFASGELTASWLAEAPYEEVLERLIAVRGLGKWSVEMFACFGLKRMDVFSTGDLGVQRGMAAFAGRDVSKLKAKGGGNKWKYMSEKEMVDMAAPFSPYRSVFMWYMWRVEETDISTLE